MIYLPKLKPRSIALAALVGVCSACGGDSSGTGEPVTNVADLNNQPLLGNDPLSGESRELIVSESTTDTKSFVQCFCDALYRSTLQIYHFEAQNSVLMIEFDNTSSAFETSAVLHLFDAVATREDIARWINNQHSDGLFINPAQPVQSYTIEPQHITITSSAYVESLGGFSGDEYEKYQIEFTVANLVEADAYHLNGFSDQASVFLQTRAPDHEN